MQTKLLPITRLVSLIGYNAALAATTTAIYVYDTNEFDGALQSEEVVVSGVTIPIDVANAFMATAHMLNSLTEQPSFDQFEADMVQAILNADPSSKTVGIGSNTDTNLTLPQSGRWSAGASLAQVQNIDVEHKQHYPELRDYAAAAVSAASEVNEEQIGALTRAIAKLGIIGVLNAVATVPVIDGALNIAGEAIKHGEAVTFAETVGMIANNKMPADEVDALEVAYMRAIVGACMRPIDPQNAISSLQASIHDGNVQAGWWRIIDQATDLDLRQCIRDPLDDVQARLGKAVVAEKLCLIHSEVSEGMEGFRKNLQDDKLPHRSMLEVELADAMIRILDLAGALQLDLQGAILEKLAYNSRREDHKIENRLAENGKAF